MEPDKHESGGSPYPRRAPSSANNMDVLYDAVAGSVTFDPAASTDSLQANFHREEEAHSPEPIPKKTPTWKSSLSYASTKQYTPYSPLDKSPEVGLGITRAASRSTRHSGYSYDAAHDHDAGIAHDAEESYDMALLSSAAPMAAGGSEPTEAMAQEDESYPLGFDVSSALGPFTPHDDEFLRNIQRQEASGHLTGGLGKGFRPDTRMRDADLMNSPTSPLSRNLSRSFTQRLGRRLTRHQTLRNMGQEQANKTGQVIEVIVENEEHVAGADLSFIAGSNFVESADFRRTETLPRESLTQIFYPQPNWKPWSIRWPYMTALILLSIGLAVMQEWLFQKYKKTGILQFQSPEDIPPGLLFFIKFMPTLLGIVYGVLWQFADIEIRRLEPYFQLSKPGGALAAESISVDYVTLFNIFRPLYAIKNRHYIVATMSSAALMAMSLVPTFASATIVLEPSRQERKDHPEMIKSLHIQPMWSRLLTSILAINALCGLIVFALLQTRRSGLQANVRGIAGLASMAVVSHILMDFKDMDTAKPKDIHEKLKDHRYMLQNSCLAPDNENPVTKEDREKYKQDILPQHPHPLILRAKCCIPFIIYIVFMMIFIPSFLFTDLDVVPEKAPWLVTLLSVVLKLLWVGLENAVRTLEPYYILSKRHAPSKTLTLDYNAMPWGYMSVQALLNGHVFVFLVGFGSVMVEFLTLLVAGLASVDGQNFLNTYGKYKDHSAYSGQETFTSFYVSVGFTMFILLYMVIVSTVVFIRRRHPFLPRQPTTIASVLAFIHQSKMLYNFVGTNKLSPAAMVRKLDDGRTYGLGWFEGRDGQMHCGIDQEELVSDYKHGIDFTQGVRPWNTQWDVL